MLSQISVVKKGKDRARADLFIDSIRPHAILYRRICDEHPRFIFVFISSIV